jgi:Flp pilus assembly protein TadG
MPNERGQALIELALVLLLLLMILYGITEFGRYFFYANTANNAARDGVRWAVTHAATSDWCDEVKQHVVDNYGSLFSPALTKANNITVCINGVCPTCSAAQPSTGSRVQIRVTWPFEIVTGSIIPFFSGSRTIVGDASMRYELSS